MRGADHQVMRGGTSYLGWGAYQGCKSKGGSLEYTLKKGRYKSVSVLVEVMHTIGKLLREGKNND